MGFDGNKFLSAIALTGLMGATLDAAPLDALAKKLAAGAAALENKRIAVLTFPYHDDKISSGSTLVSERLTTCLVEHKELRVLERNLIGALLKEKKLTETGIIDPHSLKAIGKILDSEAVVTGTLIDLPNDQTEINARLIRVDTGEVLSAGQAIMDRTWTDVPCEIIKRSPASSARNNAAVAPVEMDTVDSPSDEPSAPRKLSSKSLKLSNENFPAGHRRYLANERPPRPVSRNTMAADDSDSAPLPYYYRPVLPVYYKSGYGIDASPLPPTILRPRYPMGTVRTEKTTVVPPASTSAK